MALVLGLVNMTRSDDGQASRSNKLMRLRVIAQAVVIGILIPMGMSEIETSRTMIATMGGWPLLTGVENNERLRRLHKGIVAIPILVVAIGIAYTAFRSMMLNRASDEEENQTES